MEENKEEKELRWKAVRVEHLVQDEWIDFRRVAYELPDGTVFDPYYNYSRKHYVVIMATDQEGRYLTVRQYRHGIGKVTVEFPAGAIEAGLSGPGRERPGEEMALSAAIRELKEETGYESEDWELLLCLPSNPTVADNYAYVFRARNCRRVEGPHLDSTEFLQGGRMSAEEIRELIRAGAFPQSIHVMAFLMDGNPI